MQSLYSLLVGSFILASASVASATTIADLCKGGLVEGSYQGLDLDKQNFQMNLFCSHPDVLEGSLTETTSSDHYELPYAEIVGTEGHESLVMASFAPDAGDASSVGSNNIGLVLVLQVSSLMKGQITGHYRGLNLPGPLQFTGTRQQMFKQYTPAPGRSSKFEGKDFDGVFVGTLPSGLAARIDLFMLGNIERAILHDSNSRFAFGFYDGIPDPTQGEIRVTTSVGRGEPGIGTFGQIRGYFIDANTIEIYVILPNVTTKAPAIFKRVTE